MKTLKILGIIFMVIASTVGGAAFRLMEVLNDPNPLPLPKTQTQQKNSQAKHEAETGKNISGEAETELAVAETPGQNSNANPRGSVNVLIVGLDDVDGASRTDARDFRC